MSNSNPVPVSWKEKTRNGKRPFKWALRIEWLTEWLVYYLNRWAFIELLKIIGTLSILFGAITYLFSADQRKQVAEDQKKAKHYQAWQTINSAEGQPGNAGRQDALEDLVRDKVAVDGINLNESWLPNLQIAGMMCNRGRFHRAFLQAGVFSQARLKGGDFTVANLNYSCFLNADLINNDFTRASLWGSDLRGAFLVSCEMDAADLYGSDLERAYLYDVNLRPLAFSTRLASVPEDVDAPYNRFYTNRWIVNRPSQMNFDTLADFPASYVSLSKYWTIPENRERFTNRWDSTSTAAVEPAVLSSVSLKEARIYHSSLLHAILDSVDLEGAIIENCDLRGIRLMGAKNWRKIKSLKNSLLTGSERVPDGFMDVAIEKGANVAYYFAKDSLKLRKPSSLLRWPIIRGVFMQSIPTRHDSRDSLTEDQCQESRKEYLAGGRYGAVSPSTKTPKDSMLLHAKVYIWDLRRLINSKDSVTGQQTFTSYYMAENISDTAVTITLKGATGVYEECVYDEKEPERTFIEKFYAEATVYLPARSNKIIHFHYGPFAYEKGTCLGFSPYLPKITALTVHRE